MPIFKNRQNCLQFAAFISHFIMPSTQTFISVWTNSPTPATWLRCESWPLCS